MRADGRMLLEISHSLVVHIEKQVPELAHRIRQSQCAQLLCRLMYRAADAQTVWAAGADEAQDICEQIVKFVLDQVHTEVGPSDRYAPHTHARSVMQLKRMTQFLLLMWHSKAHMFLEVSFHGPRVYMYV
jgi:hypothetical protein